MTTLVYNSNRVDPSRTFTLRRAFQSEMSKRFQLIRQRLVDLVSGENAFGLTTNSRWEFQTSLQKLESFRKWLTDQLEGIILQPHGRSGWWENYVWQGYRKGAMRAYDDANAYIADPQQREFLKTSFGRVIPTDKVKLLASRVFTGLKGITEDMSMHITRALTDGLTRGEHPKQIARNMVKRVDISKDRAKMIARTEIIHSHAEGQLDAMEKLGVDLVGVMVEWSTAGDQHVCPKCRPLNGVVLSIQDARGLIPRHPNCRCAFIPASSIDRAGIRSTAGVQSALSKSIGAESPKTKRSLAKAGKLSKWVGAKLIQNSFPGHKGRPGEVGGSQPRSSGGSSLGSVAPLADALDHFFSQQIDSAGSSMFGGVSREPSSAEFRQAEKTSDYIPKRTTNKHVTPERSHAESIKVSKSEPLDNSGINNIQKVQLMDGTYGVFKGSDDQDDAMFGGRQGMYRKHAEREVLASEINDILGLHLVPTTVLKKVNRKMGSFQVFVHNTKDAKQFDKLDRFDGPENERIAAAFDYLIGHSDRHAGNWRLPDDVSRIHLIDNGYCLPSTNIHPLRNARMLNHLAGNGGRVPSIVKSWGNHYDDIVARILHYNFSPETVEAMSERFAALIEYSGKTFKQLRDEGPIGWYHEFGKTERGAKRHEPDDRRKTR